MRTDLFDFDLPPELVAQRPASPRDAARLLLVGDHSGGSHHARPARPAASPATSSSSTTPASCRPASSAGAARCRSRSPWSSPPAPAAGGRWPGPASGCGRATGSSWPPVSRPRSKRRTGRAGCGSASTSRGEALRAAIRAHGAMPLPPYIRRDARRRRARPARLPDGVRAAARARSPRPTASLHFTPEMLDRLAARGVERCFVTLHVGQGTFAPVKVEDVSEHRMHAERYELPEATAAAIAAARAAGGRIVAVGTTVLRVLETVAAADGLLRPGRRRDPPVRHPGLPLPRRRPPAHQLPPAAQHALHAGGGLRRARADQGRLRPRDRRSASASSATATPA